MLFLRIPLLEKITLSIICLLFLFFSRTYYFNVFSHTYYFFYDKRLRIFYNELLFCEKYFSKSIASLNYTCQRKIKMLFFCPSLKKLWINHTHSTLFVIITTRKLFYWFILFFFYFFIFLLNIFDDYTKVFFYHSLVACGEKFFKRIRDKNRHLFFRKCLKTNLISCFSRMYLFQKNVSIFMANSSFSFYKLALLKIYAWKIISY